MTLSRLSAALGLVSLFAAHAHAQSVSVSIIEHGLYTAEITATERMPNGVERNLLRNICHVVTTDKDRKSTRLNSSHIPLSRMPSSA